MVQVSSSGRIDMCVEHSWSVNWVSIFIVGTFLLVGCQSIPSDLGKTFPKETTQYIYDFPVQPGLEWWYQGKVLENDKEESYITHAIMTRVEPLSDGAFIVFLSNTNRQNRGKDHLRYRMDETGIVSYGSEAQDFLFKQLRPYPVIRFPIRLGHPVFQIDRKVLDLGQDYDRWEK